MVIRILNLKGTKEITEIRSSQMKFPNSLEIVLVNAKRSDEVALIIRVANDHSPL